MLNLLALPLLLATSGAFAADSAAGKAVYDANCTACHGGSGNGKGAAAIALNPKPADFTAATYWTGKTDEQVTASIKSGRPGTSMTAFTQLSDADLANVTAYLRTFAK